MERCHPDRQAFQIGPDRAAAFEGAHMQLETFAGQSPG